MATTESNSVIRSALATLDLTETSHLAANEPAREQIFSPRSHAAALDFARSLVVGNRGVGKSFWAAVLAHRDTRLYVAKHYPRLALEKLDVQLAFHEAAGKRNDVTPSPVELEHLLNSGVRAESIWQAVLLRAIEHTMGGARFGSTSEAVSFVLSAPLDCERRLREADADFASKGRRFLLVFDALDRLARDWGTIRQLTEGAIRLALDMRGFRAMRSKMFMRVDQAADDSIFRFPDASKLRTEQVKLIWERRDLYGMLYQAVWADDRAGQSFKSVARQIIGTTGGTQRALPPDLEQNEFLQAEVFYRLAGEFMGTDARRGRTYSWLHGHLADAFEETSPRSFLTAIRTAANYSPAPSRTAIDMNGLKAGVQAASEVRVQQLKEDYPWIDAALRGLEGLEVPCPPNAFTNRWRERGTIAKIEAELRRSDVLGPVEFEGEPADKFDALLRSLETIGVIERRAENRINMPDLFRVEARIKRRGGVKPPAKPR